MILSVCSSKGGVGKTTVSTLLAAYTAKHTEKKILLIDADHILKTRKKLNEILAANTGQALERIEHDTDRDHWLTAEEAVSYGIIDNVVAARRS